MIFSFLKCLGCFPYFFILSLSVTKSNKKVQRNWFFFSDISRTYKLLRKKFPKTGLRFRWFLSLGTSYFTFDSKNLATTETSETTNPEIFHNTTHTWIFPLYKRSCTTGSKNAETSFSGLFGFAIGFFEKNFFSFVSFSGIVILTEKGSNLWNAPSAMTQKV